MSEDKKKDRKKGFPGSFMLFLFASLIIAMTVQGLVGGSSANISFGHQLEHLINLQLVEEQANTKVAIKEKKKRAEDRVQRLIAQEKNYFNLDILFYKEDKKTRAISINLMLEEILPSRFRQLFIDIPETVNKNKLFKDAITIKKELQDIKFSYQIIKNFFSSDFLDVVNKLFLGRKFFTIGTGIVFNGRGDGGEFNFYSRYVDVKLFGAYTGLLKTDNNPYNLSDKDIADGAKRMFTGGTISKGRWNQTVYLLGLMQIDKGKEESGEKSRYNSNYVGIGLKGVFGEAYYFAEFIHETGESYIDGTSEKEDVKANAAIIGLNYYLNQSYNPVLLFQYAYGSGDKDRSDYKSPTGNTSGSDNGFLYFGSFAGGYGLKPILSNIHIIRVGWSFVPLYDSKNISLRRMNLIAKYSYYLKDESKSGINYGEASKNSRDIGHGFDVAFRWKVFSDLSFHINYALFVPGNAYASSEEMTHFIMSGFLFSF